MELEKILTVELTTGKEKGKICFSTTQTIWPDSYVRFSYKGHSYAYKVSSVKTMNDFLQIEAVEAGYYNKISCLKPFNINELIGKQVELVTAEAEIDALRQESRYC